jgi:hypothetical protein
MQQITITVDDSGKISVDTQENGQPAGEPYECESMDECLQYVKSIMSEEQGETPEEQTTEGPENYEQLWNEESKKRGEQMAAPGMY